MTTTLLVTVEYYHEDDILTTCETLSEEDIPKFLSRFSNIIAFSIEALNYANF